MELSVRWLEALSPHLQQCYIIVLSYYDIKNIILSDYRLADFLKIAKFIDCLIIESHHIWALRKL